MCWSSTKQISSSSRWKLTCSRHDIAEKLLNWSFKNNNHSLTHSSTKWTSSLFHWKLICSLYHDIAEKISEMALNNNQSLCLMLWLICLHFDLYLPSVKLLYQKEPILAGTIFRKRKFRFVYLKFSLHGEGLIYEV